MASSGSESELIIHVASSLSEDEAQSDNNSMTISVGIPQLHTSGRISTLSDAENDANQTSSEGDTCSEYDGERLEAKNNRRKRLMQNLPLQVCRTSKTHKLLKYEHIALELVSRGDKCATTRDFTRAKQQFLHRISEFEDNGNYDMVVLLRINLAEAKLENNERGAALECLNAANNMMESHHIENFDVLHAQLLMQYSYLHRLSGDAEEALKFADNAHIMLMTTQAFVPYEQAFGLWSSAGSSLCVLTQRQSYDNLQDSTAMRYLDVSISIFNSMPNEKQRKYSVYAMLSKVKLLLHWLDNDKNPLRHNVTDDELYRANVILNDVAKKAEFNEPGAFSRHGRLQATINIRRAQKFMGQQDVLVNSEEQQEQVNGTSRNRRLLDTYIIGAFRGLIEAHNPVCEIDAIELDQALSLKALLETTTPFAHRPDLWTEAYNACAGGKMWTCKDHGFLS